MYISLHVSKLYQTIHLSIHFNGSLFNVFYAQNEEGFCNIIVFIKQCYVTLYNIGDQNRHISLYNIGDQNRHISLYNIGDQNRYISLYNTGIKIDISLYITLGSTLDISLYITLGSK